MPFLRSLLVAIALSPIICATAQQPQKTNSSTPQSARTVLSSWRVPVGIPKALWNKRMPPLSALQSQKISLGQALFFDKRLSANGTISCANCHDPALAFSSTDPLAVGVSKGTRNAPTLLNSVFADLFFWDGRVETLEAQAKQPLLNDTEMGPTNEAELIQRLSTIAQYRQQFSKVFGSEGISLNTVAASISAFERTLVSGNSPFDRYITGDPNALTESQKQGWRLFTGKAKCTDCHNYTQSSPFFTDFMFHNTGIGVNDGRFDVLERSAQSLIETGQTAEIGHLAHKPAYSQLGRFLVTRRWEDLAAFKTPTLRDVELTAPYMHDGSFQTLLDVVRFYNRGGTRNPRLDTKIVPLGLSEQEMSDLVGFLRALTSDDVLRVVQSSGLQSSEKVLVPSLN